jgi:hypothetical protein
MQVFDFLFIMLVDAKYPGNVGIAMKVIAKNRSEDIICNGAGIYF